ncbi:MAG: ArsA family ATPase [Synechococcales cyanobacterium T60_A2020_003]|nr:ArsA family ATPase [Synechococcales cyanobacterium T60_A2020_003]
MSLILTFLGKGGTGCTTLAIATAKSLSQRGQRVLLVGQDPTPAFGMAIGASLSPDPQEIEQNLKVVQLSSAILLERSWEELKQQEAKYIRTPFFKAVYGQELGVLPGMDSALALNALREYDASGIYDVIVYDGASDLSTLRMLGMPEILSWYIRRFRKVFSESDFAKALSPFIQPVASAVLNVEWSGSSIFDQPATNQVNNILDQGRVAVADPSRVGAFLVTTSTPEAIATAKYFWGSAQQVGLTVGGVLHNQGTDSAAIAPQFAPLPLTAIPTRAEDWQPLVDAIPDPQVMLQAPRPITINSAERKVSLFLPTFDKREIKLTQYGPEVTIDAGNQRRNVILPPELQGQSVSGAKFQDGYLIISF